VLRVLIIDDEQVNREFLVRALKAHGRCLAVGTGEAGLTEHRQALEAGTPFDLVFLDIMLPGMDGLKTLELMRAVEAEHADAFGGQEHAPAQVIITTVLDDDRLAARAFIQGRASSYMPKPFRAAQLREELSKLGLITPATPPGTEARP